MAAVDIYLVSVSLCIRVPRNAIRSETVVPASHWDPFNGPSRFVNQSVAFFTYHLYNLPAEGTTLFLAIWIHCTLGQHTYVYPTDTPLPPTFTLSLMSKRSFLVSLYLPSLSLPFSLFHRDSLSHTYRSFYLANPTGGFVVAWPSFSSFLPFFFPVPPHSTACRPSQCVWFWFIWRDRQLKSPNHRRERRKERGMRGNYKFMLPVCV